MWPETQSWPHISLTLYVQLSTESNEVSLTIVLLVNQVNHVCRRKVDWFPGSSVCKILLETPSWPHISLSLCVQVLAYLIFYFVKVKYC